MIDKSVIVDIVEEILDDPMFLVAVTVNPGNAIVVEIDSDDNIGIDACVTISKAIESQLDREVEDFELEVGSAGLTKAFSIPRQYKKHIGNEVEFLTKKGIKDNGVLKSADEEGFVVTITKKEKLEGAKRPTTVEVDLAFAYEDVKYTKYLIRFK